MTYILPLLAFSATLVGIFSTKQSSLNLISRLTIIIALGALLVSEWKLYKDEKHSQFVASELNNTRTKLDLAQVEIESISTQLKEAHSQLELTQIDVEKVLKSQEIAKKTTTSRYQ